ncbi:unnamed protein product [Paramecium sonneborni]|uniref:Insulin-like growth factor binding protein, N-terminal n=1 Tax=Paramecium sonneborni TaxID=65129 RepID=A0A8S1RKC7_9CILI|nr:unnamed protein product [Paramecium sonneborni]
MKVYLSELKLIIFAHVKLDMLNIKLKTLYADPRCRTCFQAADDTTNQYCLTCISGENRNLIEEFKCEFQDNYGDNNGTVNICFICDYTCGSCLNSQPTGFVTCLESPNRYLTILGQYLCQSSYYDDLTDSIECSKCYYTCQECANSPEKAACTECPETRIPSNPTLDNYECVCQFSNFFDDGYALKCQQCDFTCNTCNGPLSSNCLTCDNSYRYNQIRKILQKLFKTFLQLPISLFLFSAQLNKKNQLQIINLTHRQVD